MVWNGRGNHSLDLWFKVSNSRLHQFQFKLKGLYKNFFAANSALSWTESWIGFAPESRSIASCGSKSIQLTSLATDVKTGDLSKPSGGTSLCRKRPTQKTNCGKHIQVSRRSGVVPVSQYASRFGGPEFPRCNTLHFVGKYLRYAMGEICKSSRDCTDDLFR